MPDAVLGAFHGTGSLLVVALRGRLYFSPHLTREGRELRDLPKTTQQVAEPDSDPNLSYSRLQSLDPEE